METVETRLHVPCDESEGALLDELRRVYAESSHTIRPSRLVESSMSPADSAKGAAVAFALQCLPFSFEVGAPSISAWAALAVERVLGCLGSTAAPWRFHVFCREVRGGPVRARRCALIAAEALALLKKRHRRIYHARIPDGGNATVDEAMVQIVLESPTAGFFSFASPEVRRRLRRSMSPFFGGIVEVEDDPAPPSRAYRKLLEAETRLGERISRGEICVDLGAAPGGWTHVALKRGARVVAVDRSVLTEKLMSDPALTFVKGDAFKYSPNAPVDWLLCDIIAFPGRTLDLLDRWLGARMCRRFVVTVKFRGREDYPEIERLEAICEASGARFEVRRMCANKNEVTAMGTLPDLRAAVAD